ncbi:MAG: glycosyltransferase family 87 protein [Chthoniobacteraceae bacterium]|jgi:hypothetical protein
MDIMAIVSWSIVILAILVHAAHSPRAGSLFWTYQNAGRDWLQGQDLYRYRGFALDQGSFIYSPLAAALFVPFSILGDSLSNVFWRVLCLSAFLGSVWWWLRNRLHHRISASQYGAVFLLLLPFSVGNVNSGQANLLVISLIMLGIINAKLNRWTLSALCVALAAYYKIYPLAVGLLLSLVFPRQFSWRLLMALIALGCFSFLLQRPAYVLQQYGHWIANRVADDRQMAPMRMAPRDLWLLLRLLHCPLDPLGYKAIQLLGGLGIASLCLVGNLKNWHRDRLLTGLFSLVSCWMVLLGPATEPATYILLAPAVVLALIEGFSQPIHSWMCCILVAAFVLLLTAVGFNSFGEFNHFPFNIFQPLGALRFSIYVVVWLLNSSLWNENPRCSGAAKIRPGGNCKTLITIREVTGS